MLRRLVTILSLACAVLLSAAHAQEVAWSVDLNATVQNREGGDEQCPDQTFLFTRLMPQLGLSLDGGVHKVMGGVSWYQPMTNDCKGHKVVPVVYYKYEKGPWTASLGMLPRTMQVPTLLWSDSLNFVTPTVRGVDVEYKTQRGASRFMLDWRQMQSESRREAFNVLYNARYDIAGPLGIDAWVAYNHLAKTKTNKEGQYVNDDITLLPMLTLDLARYTPAMKALTVNAGAAVQLQRARDEHRWHTPCRLMVSANAQWRWLEVNEEFSTGKDAFPLYDRYSSELNLGDPYYRHKLYSRTDVNAHFVKNDYVDLYAGLTFHATDKITGFWQTVSCRFYFDHNMWKRHRNK